MKDSYGKSTIYKVEFQVDCSKTSNTQSLQVDSVESKPKIDLTAKVTKISSEGDITVMFNQQLLIPEVFNQTRQLESGTLYEKLTKSIKLEITAGTSY